MSFSIALLKRSLAVLWATIVLFVVLGAAINTDDVPSFVEPNTHLKSEQQQILRPVNPSPSDHILESPPSSFRFSASAANNALQELHSALSTLQNEYFTLWLGTWTNAIDWTAAVMGTHLSASLYSLSHSLSYTLPGTFSKNRKLDVEAQMVENQINKYFAQSSAFFFGEDHFSIRMQAYDDMLWVVLGWLDSIRFISEHSELHYPATMNGAGDGESDWHGSQFIPAFAHRARVFYELAEQGWDWYLCGGGMTWNPRLLPYKNAITNQLFISASISMYLHFPGDENCSPFMGFQDGDSEVRTKTACPSQNKRSTYDSVYLQNAANGYEWLKNSGMTNDKGLYVDGFHIKDYYRNHSKTECDDRNEMVYTYNQGVVLTGLRGLWEATGNTAYLEDGHELIRNVIHATGWTDTPIASTTSHPPTQRTRAGDWAGLGTSGILTELCDPYGTCSQDSQTFKSILFHHLTAFCNPLPLTPTHPGKTHAASRQTAALHRASCNEYAPWVVKNAQAALRTRDAQGRFGMWWGAVAAPTDADPAPREMPRLPKGRALDYRNVPESLLRDPQFGMPSLSTFSSFESGRKAGKKNTPGSGDPNERGRGRSVETQGGGVAVTRAMWEFVRNYDKES
ncbi:glycoside hydrolase family 76 protein [Aaosphaeria arxii CBS 175.79]|uniref:Glycoside hydrolase family 76 protein n=1 Tax=Aaosphaeria arxii CBS 175.79 TaxID=1450172 RepID=A0A6A5XLF7_9PLEO|nr:glycoside hydrolase family 76 protein [Aaosphaeria arxii CBS 175.79]KAF2013982.1 glycoside hydrolase family 76 protein [Aaosphaeria arxii CBS 175.79]